MSRMDSKMQTKNTNEKPPIDAQSWNDLLDSSPETRRHSISCADRSILHSASDTRLPLRILARSMIPTSQSPTNAPIDVKFIQMYVKKIGPEYRQNSDPTFNWPRRRQRSSDTGSISAQSSSRASSNDDVLVSQIKSADGLISQIKTPDGLINQIRSADGLVNQTKSPDKSTNQVKSSDISIIHVKSSDKSTNQTKSSDKSTNQTRSPDQKSIIVAPIGKMKVLPKVIKKSMSGYDLKQLSTGKTDPISTSNFDISDQVVTCYRVLESLFAGGQDAATNAPLLCRLKIDHLIDLRSPGNSYRAMSVNSMGIDYPYRCVCTNRRHKRQPLYMRITPKSTPGNLFETFQTLNAFITKARVRGEKTLIFDEDGRGLAPAMVVEYLMYYYHMKYTAAKIFVAEIIHDMQIPEFIEKGLLQWEEKLNSEHVCCQKRQDNSDAPRRGHKKKDAWI